MLIQADFIRVRGQIFKFRSVSLGSGAKYLNSTGSWVGPNFRICYAVDKNSFYLVTKFSKLLFIAQFIEIENFNAYIYNK